MKLSEKESEKVKKALESVGYTLVGHLSKPYPTRAVLVIEPIDKGPAQELPPTGTVAYAYLTKRPKNTIVRPGRIYRVTFYGGYWISSAFIIEHSSPILKFSTREAYLAIIQEKAKTYEESGSNAIVETPDGDLQKLSSSGLTEYDEKADAYWYAGAKVYSKGIWARVVGYDSLTEGLETEGAVPGRSGVGFRVKSVPSDQSEGVSTCLREIEIEIALALRVVQRATEKRPKPEFPHGGLTQGQTLNNE